MALVITIVPAVARQEIKIIAVQAPVILKIFPQPITRLLLTARMIQPEMLIATLLPTADTVFAAQQLARPDKRYQ